MTLLSTPNAMRIALPQTTKDTLTAQGIDAPECVVLQLTEATLRERKEYDAAQKVQAVSDPIAWTKSLIMKRAEEGTDERVVDELIWDLGPSAIASISHLELATVAVDRPVVPVSLI